MDDAVGLVEVEGVAGIIVAADAAVKAANVELLGWESIGGYTTIFFCGGISDVATALKHGEASARELVNHVVAVSITRPDAVYRNYVSVPLNRGASVEPVALGLIETRGYGVQTQVADAMVKAASVRVANVLTVANRVVCTLFDGDVGAVTEAMSVGRAMLSDYPHFLCSAILPQPVPEVHQAFGQRPPTGRGSV
jgi:microcompartment protein CcmL/EutN